MRPGNGNRPKSTQRGSAYVGMLLLVAALGVGLAKTGTVLALQQQRAKEAALLTIGKEFSTAFASYFQAGPGGSYPAALSDLVEDRRTIKPVRHLRRIYVDPLTGAAEWGLVKGPDGTIIGVFSLASGRPVKQRNFPAGYEGFADSKSYADWVFAHRAKLVEEASSEQKAASMRRR